MRVHCNVACLGAAFERVLLISLPLLVLYAQPYTKWQLGKFQLQAASAHGARTVHRAATLTPAAAAVLTGIVTLCTCQTHSKQMSPVPECMQACTIMSASHQAKCLDPHMHHTSPRQLRGNPDPDSCLVADKQCLQGALASAHETICDTLPSVWIHGPRNFHTWHV